jgi:hypothetical protein
VETTIKIMKKILTLIVVILISSSLITCRSSKKKKMDKLDEKTKKYWKWNSSTGGNWN